MKRFPWDVFLVLLAGIGLGLAYAWIISPRNLTESEPSTLRSDFKDQFRSAIAASYAASGNLPRAQARLDLLGDNNQTEVLNALAQRDISSGQFQQADQLAALAIALETGAGRPSQNTPTLESFEPIPVEPGDTPIPSRGENLFDITETPDILGNQFITTPIPNPNTTTPRPTRTALPTQGAPFQLTALDIICDPNLRDNLLQVIVYNANLRQLAGIKIIITWDSGEDVFFTGLKPELGNGYADFQMEPGISYSIQLDLGSEIATDLTGPTCQTSNGETYVGGYKLNFQQP
jgi:hypothetical protein